MGKEVSSSRSLSTAYGMEKAGNASMETPRAVKKGKGGISLSVAPRGKPTDIKANSKCLPWQPWDMLAGQKPRQGCQNWGQSAPSSVIPQWTLLGGLIKYAENHFWGKNNSK